jgi:hypothetical protein
LQTLRAHAELATTTMQDFLEGFHVEDLSLWRAGGKMAVPMES